MNHCNVGPFDVLIILPERIEKAARRRPQDTVANRGGTEWWSAHVTSPILPVPIIATLLAIMILHLAKLDSYAAERVDTGIEEIAGCGYRHGTQSAGQHKISAPQRPP